MKKILMIYKRDGDKVLDDYVDEYKNYDKSKLRLSKKIDGTSCYIDGHMFYKRYDNKKNKPVQEDGIFCYKNDKHNIYWVPVTENDKGHLEAGYSLMAESTPHRNGTYELVGPKINGNKHKYEKHRLVFHKDLLWEKGCCKVSGKETKEDGKELFKYWDSNCIFDTCEGFVLGDIEKMEPMFKIRKKDLGMEG